MVERLESYTTSGNVAKTNALNLNVSNTISYYMLDAETQLNGVLRARAGVAFLLQSVTTDLLEEVASLWIDGIFNYAAL